MDSSPRATSRIGCESRLIVGGPVVTEESGPSFRSNPFCYAAGPLRPQLVYDLRLGLMGPEAVLYDPRPS